MMSPRSGVGTSSGIYPRRGAGVAANDKSLSVGCLTRFSANCFHLRVIALSCPKTECRHRRTHQRGRDELRHRAGPEQILPCRRQGAGRCQSAGGRRRNGRLAGRVRFRQVDAAAPSGRFRRGRRGLGQRHRQWPADPASRQAQPAGARRARQHRLCVPAVQSGGPPAGDHQRTDRHAAARAAVAQPDAFRRDEVRAGLDALARWYRRLCIPARLDPVRRPAAARRHRAHAGAERPRHPGRRADRLARSRILAPRDDGHAGADQAAAARWPWWCRCTRSTWRCAIARARRAAPGRVRRPQRQP